MRRRNSSYSTFCDDNNDDREEENEFSMPSPLLPSTSASTSPQPDNHLQLSSTPPPPDPTPREVLFVKFVFYMLGIGFLLPWNAFVSAETYFMSRFTKSTCGRNVDDDDNDNDNGGGTDSGGKNFMSWLGLLYNLSGVLALIFLLLQQRAKEIRSSTNKQQQDQIQRQNSTSNHIDTTTFVDENLDSNNSHEDHDDGQQVEQQINQQQQQQEEEQVQTLVAHHTNTNTNTNNNNNNNNGSTTTQKKTVITSFSINFLIMILTSAMVLFPFFNNSYTTIHLFQIITYITILSYGTVGAFLSTAVLSYANTFFKYYTDVSVQCFISGQAVGGVVISILNLILDYAVDGGSRENSFWDDNCDDDDDTNNNRNLFLSFQKGLSSSSSSLQLRTTTTTTTATTTVIGNTCHKYNIDWGAFSYFTVCCIFLLLCVILYIILDAHPVLHYYRYYCCGIDTRNSSAFVGPSTEANIDVLLHHENQVSSSNDLLIEDSGIEMERYRNTSHGEQDLNTREKVAYNRSSTQGGEKVDVAVGQRRNKKNKNKREWGKRRNKHGRKSSTEKKKKIMKEYDIDDGGVGQDQQEQQAHSSLLEPLLQQQGNEKQQGQNEMCNSNSSSNNKENRTSNSITFHVWKSIQLPIISIFAVFCVTLTAFPSWTGKLQSELQCQSGSSRFRNDLFIPLMIVLFNCFDLLGRLVSGFVMTHLLQPKKINNRNDSGDNDDENDDRQTQYLQHNASLQLISKKITFLSIMRIVFLPAFLFCKTDNPPSSSHSVGLLYKEPSSSSGSDVYTFLLMIVFAFSNGLVSTLSFIHAAVLIPTSNSVSNNTNNGDIAGETGMHNNDDHHQDDNDDNDAIQKVASTLLNFAVGTGLLLGSLLSFVYNYVGTRF